MVHNFCILFLMVALGKAELSIGKDLLAEVASEGTSSEELYGMATVCFPGNQCNQFPAEFVYEALSRESFEPEKRSGSGYLFRSRRGLEDDDEELGVEKRGNHGYLLRTRKSDEEPTTRTTRGSYLFRTRKSDPNLVPERNSRAGYLFRTRKSTENNLGNEEEVANSELQSRVLRSSKGYLFRTRKSLKPRNTRGGYLFRT